MFFMTSLSLKALKFMILSYSDQILAQASLSHMFLCDESGF